MPHDLNACGSRASEAFIGPENSRYNKSFPLLAQFHGFEDAYLDYQTATSMSTYSRRTGAISENLSLYKKKCIESALSTLREVLINGLTEMYGSQTPSAFIQAVNESAKMLYISPEQLISLVDKAHDQSSVSSQAITSDCATTGAAINETLEK